jgi:hypothetical protein
MSTNSVSNLLDRANIKGVLRQLFFQKGTNKGSVQLLSSKIHLNNQAIEIRLSIERQLKEMNLSVFPKFYEKMTI